MVKHTSLPPHPHPRTPSLQKMQALEKNFKQQAGKDNSFHLQTVRNHISLGTEGGHPCSVQISGNSLCVANGRPAAPAAHRSPGWPLFQQLQMVSGLKPPLLGGTLKCREWREGLTDWAGGAPCQHPHKPI